MSFRYVLREIQISKILVSVLKLVSFSSDSFVVIINRAEFFLKYKRHIFNVFPIISRSLEFLKANCKSFCVQVLV